MFLSKTAAVCGPIMRLATSCGPGGHDMTNRGRVDLSGEFTGHAISTFRSNAASVTFAEVMVFMKYTRLRGNIIDGTGLRVRLFVAGQARYRMEACGCSRGVPDASE
jgi:hypothetical protein